MSTYLTKGPGNIAKPFLYHEISKCSLLIYRNSIVNNYCPYIFYNTLINSTSNTRVENGGIIAPAPPSP